MIHQRILKQGHNFLIIIYSLKVFFYYSVRWIFYSSYSFCIHSYFLRNEESKLRRVVYNMIYIDNLMVIYGVRMELQKVHM